MYFAHPLRDTPPDEHKIPIIDPLSVPKTRRLGPTIMPAERTVDRTLVVHRQCPSGRKA
jgi:hypothetical protein